MNDGWREILRPAGAFAAPLVATAAAVFGLATWCALTLGAAAVSARDRGRVRAALPLLGALCSAGPLLGLLGTVGGLGVTFRSFAGGEDAAGGLLANGVKQALFTSEIGLCIAIPGLLAHAALRRALRRAEEAR